MTKHVLRWRSAVLFSLLSSLVAVVPAWATPGVTPTTIVLGQSAALSGPSKHLGTEMRDGAMAYFDHINSKGGVNGRKIVLKSLDDGYEPERAAANTKELLGGEQVFALFGYVGTPTSNASLPMVTKDNVPFFAPLTGAQSLRSPFNANIFNIRAGYVPEMEKIVENLEGMGVKKIAVFYQDDAYGKAGLEAVERALKKRNLTVMGTATIERNSTDVAAAVAKMRTLAPPAVIIVTPYAASASFIHAMRKNAIAVPYFWNISFVGSLSLADALGKEAPGVMISQVMPSPWNEKLALIREYKKLYLATPGRRQGFVSLEGFIAAKTFVEGLQGAGSNPTRASFTKSIESAGPMDLGGFVLKFSASNHNASDYVELTVIRNDGTFMY
ncbi:MAG: ABC transporter substrate-binding protein [Pseudomonadota bacterium]|nr:ABC transporter substrate-binding protein [Pseudomonadota bacterium]